MTVRGSRAAGHDGRAGRPVAGRGDVCVSACFLEPARGARADASAAQACGAAHATPNIPCTLTNALARKLAHLPLSQPHYAPLTH